jgi:hypothetical protein
MNVNLLLSMALAALTLAACGEMATLPVAAGIGPQPVLPTPKATLVPTVNIAPAVGRPVGVAIDRQGALLVATTWAMWSGA